MSRQVLGLWPSSGATSRTFSPSKIRRLAKLPRRSRGIVSAGRPTSIAAGRKMRSRQLSQSLADHSPNTAPRRPDARTGSGTRRGRARAVRGAASGARRAVGDGAPAYLLPPQWQGLGLRPRARVREHAHERGVAVAVELGASGVPAAALVSTRRRIEHLAADQLDVVGRDRPRLASALLLGLCDQRDRVPLDLLVALGALEDRAEGRQRLDDRRVADALLAQPRHPRLDW